MTSFQSQCRTCSGNGYYGINKADICAVCSGMGELTLPGELSHYRNCGPCDGRGYAGRSRKSTCTVCKGLGVIRRTALATQSSTDAAVTNVNHVPQQNDRVFLVHGTNHRVRDQIDLYLTKELGLTVTVMSAEPNRGRTLAEKFEESALSCGMAVFLMTADDVLKLHDGKTIRRSRQNVVLEVGYFWGALGRRGRVAFLVENHPEMELPSDISGVGWIPITGDLGETKRRLRSELEAAGIIR